MLTAGEKALMKILADLECPFVPHRALKKNRKAKRKYNSVSEMPLQAIRKLLGGIIRRERRLRIAKKERAEQIKDERSLTISDRLEEGFSMLSDDYPLNEDTGDDDEESELQKMAYRLYLNQRVHA